MVLVGNFEWMQAIFSGMFIRWTGACHWSTGVEHWTGVLEWTTGVASGVCLSYFPYGINSKNMYV